MGKGEIARNEHFLFFPQLFLSVLENSTPFSSNLKLSSAYSYSLNKSRICQLGKDEYLLVSVRRYGEKERNKKNVHIFLCE